MRRRSTRAGSSPIRSVYQPGKVKADPATEVSANYTGTLKPVGFSDDPARCYVTITRLSNDAVRLSSLICEEFGMDMQAVNLTVDEQSDGRIALRSETSCSFRHRKLWKGETSD